MKKWNFKLLNELSRLFRFFDIIKFSFARKISPCIFWL